MNNTYHIERKAVAKSTFEKDRVACFIENVVVNESLIFRMNICVEKLANL